jgi:hypothetical protein
MYFACRAHTHTHTGLVSFRMWRQFSFSIAVVGWA